LEKSDLTLLTFVQDVEDFNAARRAHRLPEKETAKMFVKKLTDAKKKSTPEGVRR